MEKGCLSIIVPCYNVEEYIEECLDSVLKQTFKNYEVIMVDDGSPDSTGEILDRYAEKYENFRAIHQENGGLSAARNSGIPHAKGEYIAFLDSDDVLPERAYELLMNSVLLSGSEFATGAVKRFDSTKIVNSYLHRKGIKDTIQGTSIHENLELVYDTTSWNKVYATKLIRENKMQFPVGAVYEDIAFVMEAHLRCNSVDVIDDIVYNWRWREATDNRSITQRRDDLITYQHRLTQLGRTRELVFEDGDKELLKALDIKILNVDLPLFMPEEADADMDYVMEYQKMTFRYLQSLNLDNLKFVPPVNQVRYQAILQGDLDTLVNYQNEKTWSRTYEKSTQGYVYNDPFVLNAKILRDISLDEAIPFESKIYHVKKQEGEKVTIEGYAHFEKGDGILLTKENLSVQLMNVVNGMSVPLDFAYSQPSFYQKYRKKQKNLEIAFDLCNMHEQLGNGIWKVFVSIQKENLKCSGFLSNPQKGNRKMPMTLLDENKIFQKYNYDWQLSFVNETFENVISKVTDENHHLYLQGEFTVQEEKAASLQSTTGNQEIYHSTVQKNGKEVVFDFNLEELPIGEKYRVFIEKTNGARVPYTPLIPKDRYRHIGGKRELYVDANKVGTIDVEIVEKSAEVNEIFWKDDTTLFLKLETPFETVINGEKPENVQIKFIKDDTSKVYTFDVSEWDENKIVSTLSLKDEVGNQFVFGGGYHLYVEYVYPSFTRKVGILDRKNKSNKLEAKRTNYIKTEVKTSNRGMLRISVVQEWKSYENTKMKRAIIRSALYPFLRHLPIAKKTIVYDSYWSASYNCSPKAIYQYMVQNHPEYRHIWFFENPNINVDGPAEKVRTNTLRYWYWLARANFFVQNTNFPDAYSKRRGQVEVATLHGTFMKTMGFDEPHFKEGPKRIQENFARRNSRWDYLISPSPYMTMTSSRAYNYTNEMIESGFPRNDQLYKNNNPQFIQEVKEKLGLPLDKKVILYAPTFRERDGFDIQLEIAKMKEQLSDEYILLVRLHYFVANNLDLSEYRGFAFEASKPAIEELYLISDVMITDYSSVMFDYGHLKRPMIFFAYDLDEYRNDRRGVYLNYEETVPGPIVNTTDEIIENLKNLSNVQNDYQEKMDAFYDKFCTFGRGGTATEKVVQQFILGETKLQDGEHLITDKIRRLLRVKDWYRIIFNRNLTKLRENTIVFESFFGRKYSDNPKAIYEYMKDQYPQYKCVWNVNTDNPEYLQYFKDNHIPYVRRLHYSSAKTVARAKYWFANTRIPLWLRKPLGQTLVNTWHGTPLKTIGRDVSLMTMPGMTPRQYQKDVVKDSEKWDFAVAPNQFSSDIFRQAFRLRENQMINSGYPRNDVLYNYTEEQVKRIKEALNISEDKKIVLYAPTWRDNEAIRSDYYTAKMHLDLEQFEKEFGDEAILLVRTHYLIANELDLSKYGAIVRNVSDYQDINDLYIISDVLITDYSSVFFDFSNLKRPMIFFAYDLEDYAGEIRGFYFDYQEVPGPIVKTNEEVFVQLREVIDHPEQLHPNYASFVEKYNAWEDGEATKRMVDFVMNETSYLAEEVEFNSQEVEIEGDFILWDKVYGEKEAKILQNVLIEEEHPVTLVLEKKAILMDPIRKHPVGKPYYQVSYNGETGWVSESDIFREIK